MTREQALDYIQTRIRALAVSRYPNDQHRQLLYTVGFLQGFTADLICEDSINLIKFKKTIDKPHE
jgi:hypothetical protein